MKRILLASILIVTVFGVTQVLGAEAVPEGIKGCTIRHDITINGVACPPTCQFDTDPNCGQCCTLDIVYTVTDWVFMIVVSLATIFILFGAFNFLTAGGSPEKVTIGRNYLIYAAIGIIIALLAKVIPSIAKSLLGLT